MVPQISVGTSPVIRLGLGLCFLTSVMAFDMALNTNLAVYWGQNSYGAYNPGDTAAWQQSIEYYCGDSTIDTFPIAFLTEFYSTGDLPSIDLANTCSASGNGVLGGTNLANCTFLAAGIETCQQAGKIVTMSIGGATADIGFASDSDGQAYAQSIWDTFLGGSSTTRPFGTAILDGIDMDIEGGSQVGYTTFLTTLRSLMDGGDKQYYITAAPQCPYPDANIGTTLDSFGFDAVYVQFYNNQCEVSNFNKPQDWNFGTWDSWAKNTSPNKDVKVYIGVPASSSAAGSGYVDASTLATIISQTKSQYSSFGGVMLWDVSQAHANGRYDQAVKAALTGSSVAPPVSSPAATTTASAIKGTTTSSGKATTTSSGKGTTTSSGKATTTSSGKATTTSSGKATTTSSGKGTTTSAVKATTTSSGKATTASAIKGTTTSSGKGTTTSSGRATTTSSKKATTTSSRKATTSAPPSPSATTTGGCAGVSAWESNIIYNVNAQVTYNNQLWTAVSWNENTRPDLYSNAWTGNGSC